MTDDVRPQSTTARAPFDDVDADVILHTSDHVDFHVFRLILTLSSPFFQGMFSLPQPNDTPARPNAIITTPSKSNRPSDVPPPSIDISEDSATLDTLLRILYPNTRPAPFRDIAHALSVAHTASKYVLAAPALDTIADLVQTQFTVSHPLQVYLVACRMGWENVARAAARRCLNRGSVAGPELDTDDLLRYPGAGVAYHRLETYRVACMRAIETKLDEMDFFDQDMSGDCGGEDDDDERDSGGISEHCLSRWTAQYAANLRMAVIMCPTKDKLKNFSLTPEANCGRCNIFEVANIATARHDVASKIKDVFSEVQLRFGP